MTSYSFHKSERLNGPKEITRLFEEGESTFLYPFKVQFLSSNGLPHHRVLIMVPKKIFRKAVERNLIKRRIRESYRLSIHRQKPKKYDIGLIYIAKEILSYDFISERLEQVLNRLN